MGFSSFICWKYEDGASELKPSSKHFNPSCRLHLAQHLPPVLWLLCLEFCEAGCLWLSKCKTVAKRTVLPCSKCSYSAMLIYVLSYSYTGCYVQWIKHYRKLFDVIREYIEKIDVLSTGVAMLRRWLFFFSRFEKPQKWEHVENATIEKFSMSNFRFLNLSTSYVNVRTWKKNHWFYT